MKVKRLELQGFKSFKDRTIIHFDDGVTGIVGPNGCGKSNIVDSFFWVMGEQSAKHLRGTTSSDLIFNGSEKYPSAAFAEVTMVLGTLVQGQDREIAVTRRLHRDGETEYLLNGEQCRLRDIHELFMDTGAGPKAYSIIEQGQISRIVASKPEDRRVLIEEAAGITKFKVRKKESLRKIEATQANLQRINDMVTEIERQLTHLEKQAAKARQYKTLKEELKNEEILWGLSKYRRLVLQIYGIKRQHDEALGQETLSKASIDECGLKLQELKILESEFQGSFDEKNLFLNDLQRRIAQLQTRIQLHERSLDELTHSRERLYSERDEVTFRLETLAQQLQNLEDQQSESMAQKTQVQEEWNRVSKQVEALQSEVQSLNRTLDVSRQRQKESVQQRIQLTSQVQSHEAKVEMISLQLVQKNQTLEEREISHEEALQRWESAQSEFAALTSKKTLLESELNQKQIELKNLVSQHETLSSQERQMSEQVIELRSRVASLREFVQGFESLDQSKDILRKDSVLSQWVGSVVATLIEVEPGYEFAAEALLSQRILALVLEDSKSYQLLRQRLHELDQAPGKLSFLMKGLCLGKPSESLPSGVETLEKHIRYLSCETELRSFFSQAVVVDDIDKALSIRSQLHSSMLLVTRQGELLDGFGFLQTGGSVAGDQSFLAKKALLEGLVLECERVEQSYVLVTSELTRLQESKDFLQSQVSSSERTLVELIDRYRDLDLSLKYLHKNQTDSSQGLSKVREEIQDLETQRSELWIELDEVQQELKQLQEVDVAEDLDLQVRQKQEELSRVHASQLHLKVELATNEERAKHYQEKKTTLTQEQNQRRVRLSDLDSLLNNDVDTKSQILSELEEFREQQRELIEKASEVEEDLSESRSQYETVKGSVEGIFEKLREAQRRFESAQQSKSRFMVDMERGRLETEALIQSIYEKYGYTETTLRKSGGFAPELLSSFSEILSLKVTPAVEVVTSLNVYDLQGSPLASETTQDQELPAQALERFPLDQESENQVAEELDRLKERLRRLGEVNLLAVEEYDQQKARLDFFLVQRQDLLQSISDLEKAIERINKTSEERFSRAFEEINKRFQQIFPLVFGGGRAQLEFTQPDNLSETGLEIMAEPPGKKIGSIQLMSGGEKALTAVALIFSIFLIKPSPFCVLDEVDAPLDDHNVGKFNMLLREMALRSQFIIITHNKRTMELNNKLYGVTMEEPGVSKTVSLQLQ